MCISNLQARTKLTLYLAAKGIVRMPGVSITETRDQQDSFIHRIMRNSSAQLLCILNNDSGKIIFTPIDGKSYSHQLMTDCNTHIEPCLMRQHHTTANSSTSLESILLLNAFYCQATGTGTGPGPGIGDWGCGWEMGMGNGNGKMEIGKWEIESTPIPSPRR